MGLLDDLRNQAQDRKEQDEANAASAEKREAFYRDEIQPRMTKAYQFFMELAEHLNYVNLETRVAYPLMPNGERLSLRQGDYTVVIDSSKNLKRIDVNFQCKLEKPIVFEMFGRDAILRHVDRLDRYYIKYEHKDRKDTSLELVSSKFLLEGPLPLKIVINADVANGVIQLVLRNFTDPGNSRYTIQTSEFDDAFLDRLGQFMLRKTNTLFDSNSTMDSDAKEALRRKLQQEAVQREQELIEAEERRKAEEAAEREKTAKEQLKRAVNTQKEQLKRAMNSQVAKGKESLKGMFDKLKKQASASQQTPPAQSVSVPPMPTKPVQTQRHVATNTVMPNQVKNPATAPPPVNTNAAIPGRASAVPAKMTRPQAPAASISGQSTSSSPAQVANTKPANPPVPAAVQAQKAKKTQPPKVYNAPPGNPFLKPEPPVEPPVDVAEQEAKAPTPAEKPKVDAISNNPFLKPQTPVVPPVDVAKPVTETPAEKPKVDAASNNPFLKPQTPVVSPVDAAKSVAGTPAEKPKLETTPVENTSLRSELTLEQAEPDLTIESPIGVAKQEANARDDQNPTEKPKLETTPVANSSPSPELTLEPVESDLTIESTVGVAKQEAKTPVDEIPTEKPKLEATPEAISSPRPELTLESSEPDLTIESPVESAAQEQKPSIPIEKPKLETTHEPDIASRPDLTAESLGADLEQIMERDKQKTQHLNPDSAKIEAPIATPSSDAEQNKLNLKPGELNTSLSDIQLTMDQDVSAKDTAVPEAADTITNSFLNTDELDIDLSGNVELPRNNDSNENS